MKYKVGDKVRLRNDLKIDEIYGSMTFLGIMGNVKDKILTIAYCACGESSNLYKVVENTFWYSEEMFEEIIMTNFDKVKEELALQDIQKDNSAQFTLCNVIHKVKNERDCTDRSCSECVRWLEAECKPGFKLEVVLTEAEKVILENIDKRYKYIARDKDGSLYIFNEKPTKEDEFWDAQLDCCRLEGFEHLFKFVLWEDDAPYEIAELLKE